MKFYTGYIDLVGGWAADAIISRMLCFKCQAGKEQPYMLLLNVMNNNQRPASYWYRTTRKKLRLLLSRVLVEERGCRRNTVYMPAATINCEESFVKSVKKMIE